MSVINILYISALSSTFLVSLTSFNHQERLIRRKLVKKLLKLIISSVALVSLISCTDQNNSSKEVNSSDPINISSETPSTSLEPTETYYHVRFVNYDESLLYEVDVKEGEAALYSGETPTKPEDDEFTYEFKGWDKDLSSITDDVTTMAEYSYIPKENWGSIIWF